MAGEKDGEYILLYMDWKDHPEYIKGWVDIEQAQKELDFQLGDVNILEVEHTYAFWGVGRDEMGDPCSMLNVRDNPGRGRFKVTECKVKKN